MHIIQNGHGRQQECSRPPTVCLCSLLSPKLEGSDDMVQLSQGVLAPTVRYPFWSQHWQRSLNPRTSSHQWTKAKMPDSVLPPWPSVKAIKCLLKATGECMVKTFATTLGTVVDKNDHTSWVCLLRFSSRCLRHPEHGGGFHSLTTAVI